MKRELLSEDAIVFDNPSYDDAIIGESTTGQAIYDYDLMVEQFMKDEGVDEEEASDFISYNTIRALDYSSDANKPIVMYRIE